jgi:tetratricopeptide (TPR) repeat protein
MFSQNDAIAQETSGRSNGSGDRLNSWKEVARYLRRDIRTVQIWENQEGLPIHRHFHRRQSSIFAFRCEIDAWYQQRTGAPVADQIAKPETAAPSPFRYRLAVAEDSAIGDDFGGIARYLDHSTVELLTDYEAAHADFILRRKAVSAKFCIELYSNKRQIAIWSRVVDLDHAQRVDEPARLAQEIHESLWLHSASSIRFAIRSVYAPKPAAREAYVKGRYLWNKRTEEDLRKALISFRTAIWHDPEFALAHTGLADTLTLLCFYQIVSSSEAMPHARIAALRALTLDPNSAEAHASLANINFHFDRKWEAAGQGYRRAIECNPGYALGYHWYANLLAATGQHDSAHFAIMRAVEIDPTSLITQIWAGFTSYLAGRFDEAIRRYRSALELDKDFPWTHMYMAQALEEKGDYKEALECFDTAAHLAGGNNCILAMKAHAHAASGNREAALAVLAQLQRAPFGACMPSLILPLLMSRSAIRHRPCGGSGVPVAKGTCGCLSCCRTRASKHYAMG